MNVIRPEKFLEPTKNRWRKEDKSREKFVVPPAALPKHHGGSKGIGLIGASRLPWPSTSSSRYKSPIRFATDGNGRGGGGGRGRGRGTGSDRGRVVRTDPSRVSSESFGPSSSRRFEFGSTNGKNGTRTTTTGCGSSVPDATVVLAITTGRGDARAEVGMAAIDLRCPWLVLCQISDSQTYANTLSKIHLFDPVEVLMPDTIFERTNDRNVLRRAIGEKFPELEVTPISRIHFNESVGMERVRTLCASEYSSVELFVKQKYYALAAAAALLKYVEFVQRNVYAPKSMKIELQGSPNATAIDIESARSLELVLSQAGERNFSLLGVLDHCCTPMGRRLLRASILQPPCDERVILERQSAVAELVSNHSLRALLQPVIRRLLGADRLVALSTMPSLADGTNTVQSAEQNLNYTLLLKNSLDAVAELGAILPNAEAAVFHRICEYTKNPQFRLMKEKILETIHSDARFVMGYASSNMQRCFAIKAGINDLLDVARQTYCELIDDMKTTVENLAVKYGLPLSLGCNASLGYHVRAILQRDLDAESFDLPPEFIEVRRNKRTFTMTTNILLILSQQCKIAREELHLMSNVLLRDLLKGMREHIGCLFQLSADVAELDTIISLATVSCAAEYVRPTFGHKLELENSTHPVMEAFGRDRPIPNDVRASVPRNFHVITGPNMSGKSTYLKQVVLLQIMAQIGCYVPATKATFRIADRVLCKISFREDIECNASTFALEVKEAQYILRSVTANSLIVLDELCRGTTVEEGSSIAWAICERLSTTTAFVFAATHFFRLTKLADFYLNVTNHCFETVGTARADETSRGRLTYIHRLKSGIGPIDDYGIALAELSGLPKSLTERARKYASELSKGSTDGVPNVTTPNNPGEPWYDFVAEAYELLELGRFDRENVVDLAIRFSWLREKKPNPWETRNNVEKQKAMLAEGAKERVPTKRANFKGVDIDSPWQSSQPSQPFQHQFQRAPAEIASTKTPQILTKTSTFVNAVRPPESLTQVYTISPNYNDKVISSRSLPRLPNNLIHGIDSIGRGQSSQVTHRASSFAFNSVEPVGVREATRRKSPIPDKNETAKCIEEFRTRTGYFGSTATDSIPSISFASEWSSMQMSLSFSSPKLFEYCLSDEDLRPSGSLPATGPFTLTSNASYRRTEGDTSGENVTRANHRNKLFDVEALLGPPRALEPLDLTEPEVRERSCTP